MTIVSMMVDYPQASEAEFAEAVARLKPLIAVFEADLLRQSVAVAQSIPAGGDFDPAHPSEELLLALWLGRMAFARLVEVDPVAAVEVAGQAEEDWKSDSIGHDARLRLAELGEGGERS